MVVNKYDPVYILRVSDDMAIAPRRLPAAVAQWVAMGTDYIGCMVCFSSMHQPLAWVYSTGVCTVFDAAIGFDWLCSRSTLPAPTLPVGRMELQILCWQSNIASFNELHGLHFSRCIDFDIQGVFCLRQQRAWRRPPSRTTKPTTSICRLRSSPR